MISLKDCLLGWANLLLKPTLKNVKYCTDFSDGTKLAALLLMVCEITVKYKENPTKKERKANIQACLNAIKDARIKMPDIKVDDLCSGSEGTVVGILQVLVRFRVQHGLSQIFAYVTLQPEERMLKWISTSIQNQYSVNDYKDSWLDGVLLGALVESIVPGTCSNWKQWLPSNKEENVTKAMRQASDWLDISQLIPPNDMINPNLDKFCRLVYLSQFLTARIKPGYQQPNIVVSPYGILPPSPDAYVQMQSGAPAPQQYLVLPGHAQPGFQPYVQGGPRPTGDYTQPAVIQQEPAKPYQPILTDGTVVQPDQVKQGQSTDIAGDDTERVAYVNIPERPQPVQPSQPNLNRAAGQNSPRIDWRKNILSQIDNQQRPRFEKLLKDPANLEIGKLIGQGEFGEVHEGRLCDGTYQMVAVKKIKGFDFHFGTSKEAILNFLKEAATMQNLCHENVLPILGFIMTDDEPLILLKLMKNNLKKHLRENKIQLTEDDLFGFMFDAAKGLEYLADIGFVHRDVAARNCLIDGCGKVLLSDFGFARDVFHKGYYRLSTKTRIPVNWMATECVREHKYTAASDVYAFAVLMWEILSYGRSPRSPGQRDEVLLNELLQPDYVRKVLKKPTTATTEIHDLMRRCWNDRPEARPSMSDVVAILKGYVRYETINDPKYNYAFHLKQDPLHSQESTAARHQMGGATSEMFQANLVPQSDQEGVYEDPDQQPYRPTVRPKPNNRAKSLQKPVSEQAPSLSFSACRANIQKNLHLPPNLQDNDESLYEEVS